MSRDSFSTRPVESAACVVSRTRLIYLIGRYEHEVRNLWNMYINRTWLFDMPSFQAVLSDAELESIKNRHDVLNMVLGDLKNLLVLAEGGDK